MPYQWVEHTAELELQIEAESEERVFHDALRAFAEVTGDGGHGDPVGCEIALECSDRGGLLVQWLDELVYRAETGDLVPDAVESLELGRGGLRAVVRAHRDAPRHFVKGVTYHRLAFERHENGFRATVVLDV